MTEFLNYLICALDFIICMQELLLAESSKKMMKRTFMQYCDSFMVKQSIIIYNTIKELQKK